MLALVAHLLAAHAVAEQCLLGIGGGGSLGATGVATIVATKWPPSGTLVGPGACAGRSAADRSFVCGGPHKLIQVAGPRAFLGAADFAVSVSLRLEGGNGTAASLQFLTPDGGQETLGLDGDWSPALGTNAMFLAGPRWGANNLTATPCPAAGRWFNLSVARTAGVLAVRVDGAEVFRVPLGFAVSGIALRPWRATMHARSLALCAPELPAPGGPPPPDPHHLVAARLPLFPDHGHQHGGFANYSGFRIPALLVVPAAAARAPADVVLAFAEGRGVDGAAGCDSCGTRITMLRSTDAGRTFGDLVELTGSHASKGAKGTGNGERGNWTGNAVPLFDDGRHTKQPPSVSVVYCRDNNQVFYRRSTDFGLSFGAPVNISAAAHPRGVAAAPNDYFTGPGGGVQLQAGPRAGRLLVPAIATYTGANPAACPISSDCCASPLKRV